MSKAPKFCSFCGRAIEGDVKAITAPGVAICKSCVKTCSSILNDENESLDEEEVKSFEEMPLPTPKELKAYLDEYVIGQDEAKKVLSVAVYNHYKKIKYEKEIKEAGVTLDKSNILLIGPTGTGKTLLASTLAKKLNVPFAIADATTLTEAGYVGEDVENILLKLIENADYDIEKAQRGIIFLDEVDKISKKGENVSITRDVSGEGVQQGLLKIIEGTVASVPPQGGRKHPNQEMLKIDTSNILFICGGAFVGLEKVIEKRTSTSSMGFGAKIEDNNEKDLEALYKELLPDDLMKYGLIPEFIGRLPIHTTLNNLKVEDLERILTEPNNSIIRQYQESFALDGIELSFTPECIKAIAKKSYEQKTGARGLRSIVENMMLKLTYDIPSIPDVKEVIIDEDCVIGGKEPIVLLSSGLTKALE